MNFALYKLSDVTDGGLFQIENVCNLKFNLDRGLKYKHPRQSLLQNELPRTNLWSKLISKHDLYRIRICVALLISKNLCRSQNGSRRTRICVVFQQVKSFKDDLHRIKICATSLLQRNLNREQNESHRTRICVVFSSFESLTERPPQDQNLCFSPLWRNLSRLHSHRSRIYINLQRRTSRLEWFVTVFWKFSVEENAKLFNTRNGPFLS